VSQLFIKNGTVVFEEYVQKCDILIKNGKIAGFYTPGDGPDDVEILDASGLHIMPGSIDPHMHLGIYRDFARDMKYDTQRAAIGGVTTLVNFHRSNEDYFKTIPEAIKTASENSIVDFAFTIGIIKKKHIDELEDYVRKLKITSFKFYFDKQDELESFYGLEKGSALTSDKADMYFILQRMKEIDDRLLLCLHCEDTELFVPIGEKVKQSDADQYTLKTFGSTRPDFAETSSVMSAMWVNSVVEGNIYIVHLSSGSSARMIKALKKETNGRVSVETCPHYLALDDEAPCNLNGKVVPPIHKKSDGEALWRGIIEGTINSMGTDNCPIDLAKKYEKGTDVRQTRPGFPGAGMILPVLISEGYHKRGISLSRLSQINSINTARRFLLADKGEMKVGCDADFAMIDLEWEREIDKNLFGDCDFSIYEGMKFKGWPRYTMVRGTLVQKDGKVTAQPGHGIFIERNL